jgi:hypothetical protein
MMDAMNLWIANLDPAVTDEELKAFLAKYGCPAPNRIERVPGDGSRPAAMLSFDEAADQAVLQAQLRLEGMYWKDRRLSVQTTLSTSRPRT